MAPSNFNHIVLSQQAALGSCTTPILSDGAITPQKIGTLASVVIQDITYTAASGGTSGNSISIAYIEDVLPEQEMVTVVGNAIIVHIGNPIITIEDILDSTHFELVSTADIQIGDTIMQGSNSTTVSSVVSATELQVVSTAGFTVGSATDNGLLSTATQVLAAVQNSYLASTMVTAFISGTPSNKQIGVSSTNLLGGQHSVIVSGIQADSNSLITGNVQLISGTNVTLIESGNSITINSTGGSGGANTSLSNLISPTALNQDLLPASDGGRSLGSSSLQFGTVYTYNVNSNNDDLDLTSTFNVYLASGSGFDIILNSGSGNINADTHNITNIGTVNATSVIISNFQLTASPSNGYVLTSDSSGNGTWQFFSGSGLTPSNFIVGEIPAGLVNGSNTIFTTAFVPVSSGIYIYLNGMRQKAGIGNDYTLSGDTVTFSMAPQIGDAILVDYIK